MNQDYERSSRPTSFLTDSLTSGTERAPQPPPVSQSELIQVLEARRAADAFVEHSQSVLFTWQPALPALASKSPGAAAAAGKYASERTAVGSTVPLDAGDEKDPLASGGSGGALNTFLLDRFWAAAGIQLSSSAAAEASHDHLESLLPPGGQVALPAFLGEELSSRAMLAAAHHYQLRARPSANGAAPRIDAVLEHNASVASSLGADRSSLETCRRYQYIRSKFVCV